MIKLVERVQKCAARVILHDLGYNKYLEGLVRSTDSSVDGLICLTYFQFSSDKGLS